MPKFDLRKTQGIGNVMNAVQQVKNVNNILPLTEAKELLIENIYPSVENFYSIEDLDDLSESIRELGILQPLLVSERDGGTYEIIAGNRRYEASKMAGLTKLPCIVKQNVELNIFKIMLIHANMFRVKSDIERAMEVSELKKAIIALKSTDKSIKGRTSEIAGQVLNLSYRQVDRLDNLNKLIPEIQELVRSERITSSGAEQFANLEESVQKEIYEVLVNSGMDINRREAAKLREEFMAKSREMEIKKEVDMEDLREQIREEQEKLLQKEKELELLTKKIDEANEQFDVHDKNELEKVKLALVTALKERNEIDNRYKQLLGMLDNQNGAVPVMVREYSSEDTEKLMYDVKRKIHLQECIGQLRIVSRVYAEYEKLCRSSKLTHIPDSEVELLDELVRHAKELSYTVYRKGK